MKGLSIVTIFIFCWNFANAQLSAVPYPVWNDPTAPPSSTINIRSGTGTSYSIIDQLGSTNKLVAIQYIPNQNGFDWYKVDLPGTTSITTGYCAAWYISPNYYAVPYCQSSIVTIGSNNIYLRPSAGNTSTNVTISGVNAKVFPGQKFVVEQQTTVGSDIWYRISLTNNCLSSTNEGWIAGYYQGQTLASSTSVNINPLPAPTLNTPTSVTSNSMYLSWSAVPGASSYTISYNGNTTSTSNNYITLSSLASATTYNITVKTVFGTCTSPSSNQVSSTTGTSCSSPSASFSLSQSTITAGGSVTMANNSTGNPNPTYSWSVSPSTGVTFSPSNTATNPTISFANTGSYTISLTASNSCTPSISTATNPVTVNAGCTSPSASFSLSQSTITAGGSVTVANNSTGNPSPTYSWSVSPSTGVTFSPSNTATNPTISFANTGSYTISLTASNSCTPSTSTATNPVTVTNTQTYTIAGTVTNTSNMQGQSGVAISATGLSNQTTNSIGQFSFTVPQGWSGTVTPSLTGYAFSPISQPFSNISQNQVLNFSCTQNTTSQNCYKPFLRFPMDGASDIATQTHFQWEALPGSNITYEIDVRQPGSPSADISQTGITQTRFEYTGQLNISTTYQWKVRAWVNSSPTQWSDANRFTIRNSCPSSGFGSPMGHFNNAIVYNNNNNSSTCQSCAHPNSNPPTCQTPCSDVTGVTTGLKWQCVEFADRYFRQIYGLNVYSSGLSGDANSYVGLANNAGMIRFLNTNTEKPKTGDIIVWQGANPTDAGHVAIVKQVIGNQVAFIQQNSPNLTNTANLIQNNFLYTFPTGNVGPCLGWVRAQPTILSPQNGDVLNTRLPLFSWNINPSEQNSLANLYNISIYEKDASGCFQQYFVKTGITTPQYQMATSLNPGKDYYLRLTSITNAGAVSNDAVYFSVDINAHKSTPPTPRPGTPDSINKVQFHTYQTLGTMNRPVPSVRIYAQQNGKWADFETTNPTGDIFTYNLFPGITDGDSILATANGYYDKVVKITTSDLTNGIINIQMQLINGTNSIIDPAVVSYVNGYPIYGPFVTKSNVDFHITAINHDYYEIAQYSELDSVASWDTHLAIDSMVPITLNIGLNSFTIRYVNSLDTVYYLYSIRYVPSDSLASQTYKVFISSNQLNNSVSMFVNGSLNKVLSADYDSVYVPIGTNYFTFVKSGYQNFNAATSQTDTINTQWMQLTSIPNNLDQEMDFLIYPNPSSNSAFISYALSSESSVSIKLTDLVGNSQLIFENERQTAGPHNYKLNEASLSSGIYICTLKIGSKEVNKKFIIIK